MNFDRGFSSWCNSTRSRSLLLLATILGFVVVAVAQVPDLPPQKGSATDFGAETIDEDTGLAKKLPVDLGTEEKQTTDQNKVGEFLDQTGETDDAPTAKAAHSKEPNEDVTALLNVKDVEIAALIKSFSKLTNRNYIVDSNVKGKVTMHLATPVSIAEALKILDSVLLLKGFTTVPVGKNIWKVIQAKDAKQTTIPTVSRGSEHDPTDALITQLIRLRYVKAQDLQQTLAQFVSREGILSTSTGTNALIMIDSAANVERIQQLAEQLDVPAIDQDITIIPVQFAEAKDLADKINEILGSKEDSSANASNVRVARGVQPPVQPGNVPNMVAPPMPNMVAAALGADRRALPFKVIADERTNSVIVVADPQLTLKVKALAEQLDSKIDRSGGRFWVYRLKHAEAKEMAEVIGALISGTGQNFSDSDSSGTQGSSLSRSSSRNSNSRGSFGGGLGGSSGFGGSNSRFGRNSDRGLGSSNTNSNTGVTSVNGGGQKVNFEGEVSIAADTATNSLIINASRSDYFRLKDVLDILDQQRRQVLVEATILEVSLTDRKEMGIEMQGTTGTESGGVVAQTKYGTGSPLATLLSSPQNLTDLSIAVASSGSLTLPGGLTIPSQAFILNALSQNQNVNVLSSPTILTTDNQEAEIIVGENVPFVTGTGTNETNLSNTFNQIERQDVGITLRITPQVGQGEFVSLRIFVEVSGVVEETRGAANGPTTTIRTTETNVEVKNGQMVVTGGLIADSVTSASRGVPYFEDIPVLGALFRRDADRREKRNLMIFITPRIITDQFEAREATIDKRDDLERTIEQQDSFPSRKEILRSENIDRVTVAKDGEVNKPTLITPQKQLSTDEQGAIRRTEKIFAELTEKTNSPSAASGKGTIELTVKPKLPTTPEEPRSDNSMPARRAMLSSDEITDAQYVVLRKSSGSYIGLYVPKLNGTAGPGFFEVGGVYAHGDVADKGGRFVCVGKYANKSEALSALGDGGTGTPKLTDQALTPEELLSLGQTGWLKTNN